MFCVLVGFRLELLDALGLRDLVARESLLYGSYLAVAVAAVWLAVGRGELTRDEIGIARWRWGWALALGGAVFVWSALTQGGELIWAWLTDAPDFALHLEAAVRSAARSRLARTGGSTAYVIAAVSIGLLLSPVVEELLYRSLLLATIRRAAKAPAAVLLSSATFYLAHATVYGYGPSPWFFFAGLVYGTVFAATRSLLPAVAVHFAFNFGRFVVDASVL